MPKLGSFLLVFIGYALDISKYPNLKWYGDQSERPTFALEHVRRKKNYMTDRNFAIYIDYFIERNPDQTLLAPVVMKAALDNSLNKKDGKYIRYVRKVGNKYIYEILQGYHGSNSSQEYSPPPTFVSGSNNPQECSPSTSFSSGVSSESNSPGANFSKSKHFFPSDALADGFQETFMDLSAEKVNFESNSPGAISLASNIMKDDYGEKFMDLSAVCAKKDDCGTKDFNGLSKKNVDLSDPIDIEDLIRTDVPIDMYDLPDMNGPEMHKLKMAMEKYLGNECGSSEHTSDTQVTVEANCTRVDEIQPSTSLVNWNDCDSFIVNTALDLEEMYASDIPCEHELSIPEIEQLQEKNLLEINKDTRSEGMVPTRNEALEVPVTQSLPTPANGAITILGMETNEDRYIYYLKMSSQSPLKGPMLINWSHMQDPE